ncbi:hypothetical protein Bca52824_045228 [Brassica carinata]|uniref:Uncharacterized protein n=1 Tax=Brassica carinata TaxID=52824 RepID=A0A8X7RHU7_BRACI|nr:hypothetical protein Bca52824_045228 [Brassica carinata]
MVKTKFTRNGKEVMIFGAMRNFDYGSDEAVQESKKGGERDASVSLPSLERSRIRKSVEGISIVQEAKVNVAPSGDDEKNGRDRDVGITAIRRQAGTSSARCGS